MSLLVRMASNDSIHEMEAAGHDRYWDALACSCDNREFGACYLIGYTVEMALKTAYFSFLGVPPADDLGPRLNMVRRSPMFQGRRRNLHHLLAWAELLVETRTQRGRPLNPLVASALLIRVGEFVWNWSEVMRYRASVGAEDEAIRLFRGADWILANHLQLWR